MRQTTRIFLVLLALATAESCRKHLPVDGERCTAGDPNCICDPQSGDCTITGVNNPGPAGCTPLTCGGLKATCGEFADTCTKKTLDCGNCDSGQVCQYQKDSSGNPTTGACITGTATSCAAQGFNCGTFADPITNAVHDCTQEVGGGQACPTGTTCGGSGLQNVCGCTPLTCTDLGRVCGSTDENGSPLHDGCGGTLNCDVQAGGCGTGKVCNPSSGTCSDANCTAKTCAELGNPCGQVSDGCGGLIACDAGRCTTDKFCDPTTHKCISETTKDDGSSTNGDPTQSVVCDGRSCGGALDACNVNFLCSPSSVCGAQDCIGNHCSAPPVVACPIGRCGRHVKDAYSNPIASCSTATCPPGQVCADSTDPGLDSTGYCVDPGPTTCLAQGKNCGYIEYNDGTGTTVLNCGGATCPTEPGHPEWQQSCGGAGVPGVCALAPRPVTCIASNVECGPAYNSCGDKYDCGNCAVDNKCQNEPAQDITHCEACTKNGGANGDQGDYFTCNSTNTPLGPYLNHCGTKLDNHCYGTLDCGCPADNSAGLYGAPYKQSTGTIACSTNTPDTLGQCACTPDPNVCKNANACESTLPDDGCGHPVNCGVCSAAPVSKGSPTVCEQDNKTCCTPNINACASSCSATATTLCNGQVTVSCTGCTTSATGDTETLCGGECTGNSNGPGACKPDKTCCGNNAKYSPTGNNCCADATAVLSTCSPVSNSCQTATTGLCCEPWSCATYLTAHPTAANSFFTNLPDGCGGTLGSCDFCNAGAHYGSTGAATSDGLSPAGTCCECQNFAASDCGTNCNQTLPDRVCTAPSGEAAACSGTPAVNTSPGTFTCTAGNDCPGGDVCFNPGSGNACCAPCGANDCNETKCGVACACSGSAACVNSTKTCCASGVIAGSTCCAAGQVVAGGACCNAANATADKSACCSGGQVPNGNSCCSPFTCSANYAGQCGAALSNNCGGTLNCAGNCTGGNTCSGGVCSCPGQHVCAADECGTFGPSCNSKDCGNCAGNSDGKTVCNGNTCQCPGAPSCGNQCSGTVGSGSCTSACTPANCPSGSSCVGTTCTCPAPSCGTVGAVGSKCGGSACDSGTCSGTCVSCSIAQCDTDGGQVCYQNKCCLPDTSGQFNYCQDHQGGQFTDNCGGIHNCNGGGSSGG